MGARIGLSLCCLHWSGNTTTGRRHILVRVASIGRQTCRMQWRKPFQADVRRNICVPLSMPICMAMQWLLATSVCLLVCPARPKPTSPRPKTSVKRYTQNYGTSNTSSLRPIVSIPAPTFARPLASCLGTPTWPMMNRNTVSHGFRLATLRVSQHLMDRPLPNAVIHNSVLMAQASASGMVPYGPLPPVRR